MAPFLRPYPVACSRSAWTGVTAKPLIIAYYCYIWYRDKTHCRLNSSGSQHIEFPLASLWRGTGRMVSIDIFARQLCSTMFVGQVSTFAALAWTKRSLPMPAKVSECSCCMLWYHVWMLCRSEAEGQRWKISISSWYSQGGLCISHGMLSQASFGSGISRAST